MSDNVLWLYGTIDAGDSVNGRDVAKQLKQFDRKQSILARINSPGGSVNEAISIFTQLSEWRAGVNVQIDGLAASAASFLAMVGKNIIIAQNAMAMIHDPWVVTVGHADHHREAADRLDRTSERITDIYAARIGRPRAEIRAAMKAETWYTAQGAVEFGLADGILASDGNVTMTVGTTVEALQRKLDSFALT